MLTEKEVAKLSNEQHLWVLGLPPSKFSFKVGGTFVLINLLALFSVGFNFAVKNAPEFVSEYYPTVVVNFCNFYIILYLVVIYLLISAYLAITLLIYVENRNNYNDETTNRLYLMTIKSSLRGVRGRTFASACYKYFDWVVTIGLIVLPAAMGGWWYLTSILILGIEIIQRLGKAAFRDIAVSEISKWPDEFLEIATEWSANDRNG